VAPARTIFHVLIGASVAVTVLLAGGAHAYADPSVTEIEKQIDDGWNKLEPIIEQYNQVHTQLKDNQSKAATLQKQLVPLQLQVDVAMARVGDIADQYYRSGQGSMLNAVLTGGSPDDFVERLMMVNEMAHVQRTRITTVATVRDKYASDKKVLDNLIASLSTQDADLASKKATIEAQLASLQKLRQQAYGSAGATGNLKPVACPMEYIGGKGGIAANKACSLIGKPYVWGATGPNNFDCSGMTLTAWAAAGVSLYHYTKSQYQSTKAVSAAELRPGDLVFFYSDLHHVGLYVGGGWMVHAPKPGDFVRMAQIAGRPIAGYRRPG
jgi:cell wall-associated NlpC family hydrolase